MYPIGQYHTLRVLKQLDFGIFLDGGEDEILVPAKYVPTGVAIGDALRVFLYRDSEDRLIATTQTPRITLDTFGYLPVVDTNRTGVFLDWGLEKDLFVPFSEQDKKMVVGQSYVVRLLLDVRSQRLIGSARVERFLNHVPTGLAAEQAVKLLPFAHTELGVKCIVDGQFLGVLFHNEIFQPVPLGQPIPGYIKQIRPDLRLDLRLTRVGYAEVVGAQKTLWETLLAARGFLPLTDRTAPEVIYAQLKMSKKTFKQAVGGLLKSQRIRLTPEGIYATPED